MGYLSIKKEMYLHFADLFYVSVHWVIVRLVGDTVFQHSDESIDVLEEDGLLFISDIDDVLRDLVHLLLVVNPVVTHVTVSLQRCFPCSRTNDKRWRSSDLSSAYVFLPAPPPAFCLDPAFHKQDPGSLSQLRDLQS